MFIKETISRLRGAGATGEIVLRADSGFYIHGVVAACRAADVRFSVTARMIGRLRGAIEAIPEQAWKPIDYFLPGAGVAEISWTPFTLSGTTRWRPCTPVTPLSARSLSSFARSIRTLTPL